MKIAYKFLSSSLVFLFWFSWAFAAGELDHFEVSVYPQTAKIWEALDLTIEAVDNNNQVVNNYSWTVIIFSESDPEASLPIILEDNTYTFKASDQGRVVFENAVKFLKSWNQNIYVYDFDNDFIFWVWEVAIEAWASSESKSISIISPEAWVTIWANSVKVSWSSEKNHQIKIILNNTEDFLTTTNDNWIFEYEITNLVDWTNSIVAKILDADWNEVGTSPNTVIMVEKDVISLVNVRVLPEEVESESAYEIEVLATPALKEVSVIVNDILTSTQEAEAGKYLAKVYAPKEEWTYKVDIVLKDNLWREKTELWVASVKVTPVMNSAVVEDKQEETEAPLESAWPKEVDLTIKNLKLVELKSKSILSWNKVEWAKSYNIYKKLEDGNLEFVESVVEPKFEVLVDMEAEEVKYEYFAVKAIAENEEGEEYEWDLSEATKIQTWPEMLLLLMLAMLFGGGFIFFTQRKKA